MRIPEQPIPHEALTERIIGCGFAVHNAHGPRLNEKIYENSLCIELAFQNIPFSQQQSHPVYYREKFVGKLIPDLLIDNKVMVDTKVVSEFNGQHVAQMLSYLKVTNLQIGLLLNFKTPSMQIKRVLNLSTNP